MRCEPLSVRGRVLNVNAADGWASCPMEMGKTPPPKSAEGRRSWNAAHRDSAPTSGEACDKPVLSY